VSGSTVRLALAAALSSTDVVTVSYEQPSNRPLRGADGAVSSFSGQAVANLVDTEPSISLVSITSTPAGGAYAPGESVRVALTFTQAVNVTGRPRLKIKLALNYGEKWAHYANGSGTTQLTFAYTVVEPDRSTRGVAVLRDSLHLNGGAIRAKATQKNARLRYAGLAHDPNHKVEWLQSAPGVPRVTGVRISSDPGDDDTYALGDTIQVTATFSEAVTVDTTGGAPRLKVRMGPYPWQNYARHYEERWADYSGGSGTAELTFAYRVAADRSPWGAAVLRSGLKLNGGTIRSATDPPEDAHLGHEGLNHDRNHRVDGVKPSLYGVSVVGTTVALAFSEDLDLDSVPPSSAFTVKRTPAGGVEETVALSGTPVIAGGAALLTLSSPVLETDTDVKVSYAVPAVNRLRDRAGNEAAGFTDRAAEATDTTPPRLERGEIDGDVITLYFSEPLDESSVGGLFRANVNCGGCFSGCKVMFSIHPREVYISGNKVVLVGLKGDVWMRAGLSSQFQYVEPAGAEPGYRHVGKALRDLAGNVVSTNARGWTGHSRLENVTGLPSPERVTVNRDRLTLIFNARLKGDSIPAAGAFTVKVNGSKVRLAGAKSVAVSGRKVTLSLVRAVAQGDAVTVSYAKPASRWLHNVNCEYAESFSDVSATNFSGVSPVPSVEITSDPGDDDTYGLGETIRVTLTFSEAVEVSGKPRLKIVLDSTHWNEKWLRYESGSGTASLTFIRKVVETTQPDLRDITTAGIAVLANSLEPNGGGIRYVSSGAPAYLAHGGLDHDANHKVDWRQAPDGVPSVSGPAITSDPGGDDTYIAGDVIRVNLTFSEAVDVDTAGGTPRLKIKMAPDRGEKWANYESGGGTTDLPFAYTVAAADRSPQGIAVLGNTLGFNGGTIKSAATQTDAHPRHAGLGHDPNHKVDGRQAPDGVPSVSGVAITSDPGHDLTYARGETIRVTLTFNEAVDVDTTGGAPRLGIRMDPDRGEKWANYESGGGTTDLVFAYTVAAENRSPRGIAVLGNMLDLNGGTIRSAATQTDAHLWYAGIGPAPNHKVHGGLAPQPPGSPSITNLAISSRPTIGSTYTLGETIRVTLTFSEAVNVDTTGGAPRLKIKMDPRWGEFWADYESGGGTTGLVFAYTVAEPNTSPQGIAVMAQTLELNGGAIRSEGSTPTDAYLAHRGLGHNANHRVDWQRSGNCQRPAPGC